MAANIIKQLEKEETERLAAQRKTLQQSKQNQDHRRRDADAGVAGQEADQERRQTHDPHSDEERVLAPDEIADAPEHDRAERSNGEARRERREREDEAGRFIHAREELGGNDRGQQAVEIKVVPLENGPERRRGDDELFALRRLVMLGQFARLQDGSHQRFLL